MIGQVDQGEINQSSDTPCRTIEDHDEGEQSKEQSEDEGNHFEWDGWGRSLEVLLRTG